MSDSVTANPASGGEKFATDKNGSGVNFPYAKQVFGEDGTQTLVSASNPMPVKTFATAATDGSGAIASGGTAQNLFGSTVPVNGFLIHNPDPDNDLWFNDNGPAVVNGQGSIRVAFIGGHYETAAGYKPLGVVSIIGSTTGQKITARRW